MSNQNLTTVLRNMIWIFALIFVGFWAYFGYELYLYFRTPKNAREWHKMSEWQWRRRVRKAIDELLKETNSSS